MQIIKCEQELLDCSIPTVGCMQHASKYLTALEVKCFPSTLKLISDLLQIQEKLFSVQFVDESDARRIM